MTSKAATVPVIAGATRRVAALLPKHCRSSRPYVALLARARLHRRPACTARSSLLSFLCAIGASLSPATLNPRLGKNQPNFLFPRPSIFSTVLEQSEPGMISRVISESHYLFGVSSGWSPDCARSTRTMIARRVPCVRQPGMFIDNE